MLNVNSRTRYGILALIDLAEHGMNYYVTAQQIADRRTFRRNSWDKSSPRWSRRDSLSGDGERAAGTDSESRRTR